MSANPYGLSRGLNGKESPCPCRRHGFEPWVGKIPWRRKWQPLQYSCHGKSRGQKSLVGYSPRGRQRVGQNWATKQQQTATVNASFPVPLLNPDIPQSGLPHPCCFTESQRFTKSFWRTYYTSAFGPGDANINKPQVLSLGRRLIWYRGSCGWGGRGQQVKAQERPSWDRQSPRWVERTFQRTWTSITSSRKCHPPAGPCSKLSLC